MKRLNTKHNLIRLLVTGILCCCAAFANAQDAAIVQKPAATATTKPPVVAVKGAADLVNTFFKKYKEEGTSAAVDYIFGTNKYFTNTAGITQLKAKLDSLRQGVGNYLGKDLIVQKNASNSLVFYSYLVKHEIQPIRFTFMFYKPQNDWVLYRFKYDDQMDAELEDAGKINNKHP
ncbi:hypothetical protein [Mucilaginibacter xinganensis]|uniref:DUF3887 domain-containing protein n=1 Tax=Mucilaginibacter xinganensis TaxID=1234841 RepID=A0A223NS30_9SPHI|nr:hypothetical protein [Mucilaginibacter xinganensis]ASU32626.1 hypothetical protein MuYL_0726 [Mucilaginibacter xinganensis]